MKFNEKKKERKTPTDEERKALLKAKAAAREADRKVAEELAPKIPHMSHRQLRAELVRIADRGKTKEGINGGLENAIASALLVVLDNTKTSPVFEFKPDGTPKRVARLDQINQLGRMASYPR